MRVFNSTGICIPSKHYMVDLTARIAEIKELIDEGKYFTINRARQYGKNTTIYALETALSKNYYIVSMDFQDYGEDTFADSDSFCRDFSSGFGTIMLNQKINNCILNDAIQDLLSLTNSNQKVRLYTMLQALKNICDAADKPVVLIIDEVDSATNNQLFLDFLSGLRSHYLKREKKHRLSYISVSHTGRRHRYKASQR